jgi:hypothetical protein
MSALTIRDDISSKELRRRARQESDGRVSARVIAIANALGGYGSGERGWPGWTARPCVIGFTATTRKRLPGCAIGQPGHRSRLSEGQMACSSGSRAV